ncbi:hypothetical protein EGW08_011495 [Elysia chlorotica]|uniref:SHSP domain-containing protein n=1 Tax=Elysia chlorotica TaxID=188477 RepID=A0A3S1A265_ELYCH|nr:hypothetical protein EGW08_011495 [Elysia chlorotica]
MDNLVPEGMSTQAQQIWSMLDDMAENDPAAYRKFIERQVKEGKDYMAPPDPHMCVQVKLLTSEKSTKASKDLFINFLEWKKVPEPKSPEDPVPVTGSPITHEKDNKGQFALTSVAFNPRVLKEFGRDCPNMTDADTLVQLALDYIEHEQKVKLTRSYTILPADTPLKGDLELVRLCFTKAFQKNMKGKASGKGGAFSKDVEEMEKTFGPLSSTERDSLLSQLSNISMSPSTSPSSQDKSGDPHLTSDGIRIPGLSGSHVQSGMNKEVNGTDPKSRRVGLIQEISEDRASSVPPKYMLESEGSNLVLKVELPGVKSVSECDLDISKDDVRLVVEGRHDWSIKLPSIIDEDQARAKFSKKLSLLTLTMPLAL